MLALRLFFESVRFALDALRNNLMRTILSLLGVTIGIFAIIGVLTIVDALENSIRRSLSFLGDKVIYVEKWEWSFEPGYPWWKYASRPQVDHHELAFLEKNLSWASAISIFAIKGNLTLKNGSNSVSGANMQGVSYQHNKVSELPIAQGRYFSPSEVANASPVILLGDVLASDLFPNVDPVGKYIKLKGKKLKVIGVLEKQGSNLLNAPSNDELVIAPYSTMRSMYASGKRGLSPRIAVKGFEDDIGLENLESEIRGLMRRKRALKPKMEDNFALNRPEYIAQVLDGIIAVLTMASWFIGSFSLLVGGFGIANIMFVSVKERISQIGIQKALGAKSYFILLQFLSEAVVLSLLGGGIGIGLASLLSLVSTDTFVISVNISNVILGLGVSSIIGVLAGVAPAYSASKLDPVIAIRK